MPNTFFRFRQFVVHQERCAMKVGTDGVLLGAWAHGGLRVLDIGTGTGLIALMMAQRFPGAHVDAVDISPEACQQAMDNMSASPFAGRVSVHCDSVQHYAACPCRHGYYDSIVSNPPFFDNALRAPAVARNMARHTDALPFADLFQAVCLCLSPDGEFSAIIPFDYKSKFEGEALCAGLSLVKMCAVKTTPSKSAKRYLMAFRKQKDRLLESTEGVLETQPGVRSPWYEQLTSEFYL